MKKLIVTLMLGSLWLFSCQGTDRSQNRNDENGTMRGDSTNMDTTNMDTTGVR